MLQTETRTVRFKEGARKEEDKELDDLVKQLHTLTVWDSDYASLYACCAHRFPNAIRDIPKPEYRSPPPLATSYTFQAVPPSQPTILPMWTTAVPEQAPLPTASASSSAAPFFRPRPRMEGCAFCRQSGHQLRECRAAEEYVDSGHAWIIHNRICLPNGQPVPNDGTRRGLKVGIDTWLASQSAAPPPAQARAIFTRDPPAPPDTHSSSSRIEEVVESHLLQVSAVSPLEPDQLSEPGPCDIFDVFATER